MRNLALLNTLWDGGKHTVGRRTSESFTVKGARLTMALQAQEVTLRTFLDNSVGLARGTGFLARFLVAWPESTQGFRPFAEPPMHWPKLAKFESRLTGILEQPVAIDDGGGLSPPTLDFTDKAKAGWVKFHDLLESELRDGGELSGVRDVASKAPDNAARLAALFHVFECGLGGSIGTDAFERASRIMAWHLNESRRFLSEMSVPVEIANAFRLNNWLVDHCRHSGICVVYRKDVQRLGPGKLRDGKALDRALNVLMETGRVRIERAGRRSDILVNPVLI